VPHIFPVSSRHLTLILLLGMGTYNFLDTDQILEKAVGKTIAQIFEEDGEAAFRDAEAQILDAVQAYVRCVISTGGGIVERRQNWSKLQTGIVVWLDVDPEIILQRIQTSDGLQTRPLLQTENPLKTLKDLLDRRKDKYSQADVAIRVDTSSISTEQVADMVIRELHDFIDDNPPAWKLAKAKAQSEGLDWVK
jgi:shikimate kinase